MVVLVLDSVGCGDAPDAAAFGDSGANTLGHVLARTGVELPQLARLGLRRIPGVSPPSRGGARPVPEAAWGRLTACAPGKDTMVGHWELMGVVADRPMPLYPDGFPPEVIAEFERRIERATIGNQAASGTEIIERLGAEHVATGKPIVYTSGDSVFQLAAHEEVIPVEKLYAMCESARAMLTGAHAVGRVIARPFVGAGPGGFERTSRRRDLPLAPPAATALDHLVNAGIDVHAVGKIHDIFAGRGISSYRKTADNADGMGATEAAVRERTAPLVFTNLVDFDSRYGHRRDAEGYARALAEFDRALPSLIAALPGEGCLLITADHGNDPTAPGTDHTRERVPLMITGPRVACGPLGDRGSFADVGKTLLHNFGASGDLAGDSFLGQILQRR